MFNKHASSCARLCQIREASLVALRKISKIYACSHVLIVPLVQSTTRVSRDFHCHSSPLYHLPGELVSLSSVPMPSIDLNLWNLSRPSAVVPMSLGFTSVLTDDIVKSFRNAKSSSHDLLLVSLPLRVLCCCLLSRVSGMIVQFLSVFVRKSTWLTVHQEHRFPILHWTQTTVPCPRHSLVKRN